MMDHGEGEAQRAWIRVDTIQGANEELLSYVPLKGKGKRVYRIRAGKDECSPICFQVHGAIPLCPNLYGK